MRRSRLVPNKALTVYGRPGAAPPQTFSLCRPARLAAAQGRSRPPESRERGTCIGPKGLRLGGALAPTEPLFGSIEREWEDGLVRPLAVES